MQKTGALRLRNCSDVSGEGVREGFGFTTVLTVCCAIQDKAVEPPGGHAGGTEVSVLLTRLYAPSGDFADLLIRQQRAIGRRG